MTIKREIENYPVCFWKNTYYKGLKIDNTIIWHNFGGRDILKNLMANYDLVTNPNEQLEIKERIWKYLTEEEKSRVNNMLNTYTVTKEQILSAVEKYPTQKQVVATLFPQVVKITMLSKVEPGQKFKYSHDNSIFTMMEYHDNFSGMYTTYGGLICQYIYLGKDNVLYASIDREVELVD